MIEGGEGDYKEEILTLNDLAQKLRAARFQNGAIAFDRIEVRFDIDEKGKPTGVYFKRSKEANKLIEEFMLLANKKVAEKSGKSKKAKKLKHSCTVSTSNRTPKNWKISAVSSLNSVTVYARVLPGKYPLP